MMMFRDILYSARTLDQAVQMIKDTKRIKKYHFVVGDGKIPAAVKMKAWAPNLVIWKDNDPKDELAPNVFPNVVYHAEGRGPTARAHLSQYANGRYDADAVIQLSKAIGSLGGNLMNAVYEGSGGHRLLLWASSWDSTNAAERYVVGWVNHLRRQHHKRSPLRPQRQSQQPPRQHRRRLRPIH